MLHYHMAVITRDTALKRAVKRLTTATGATADFTSDTSALGDQRRRPDLAIFDARRRTPEDAFFRKTPSDARILFILEGDKLVDRLDLLEDSRVTSLFCYDARFDDDEFISSATKALRGEVFGLQKYFPWGVTTFTMKVKNYEEKGKAIDILMRYAKLAGVRGPVRDRVQLVCDELMMNGLYHAPTDDEGRELYAGRPVKELAQLPDVPPIQVQYGCSGRYFGVSVTDAGGSLTRARALAYLKRALGEVEIEDKATGAGLGLVSVMRSVSKLIFNLKPGGATEVIGLFDMELFAKGKIGARSLHVFTEKEEEREPEAEPEIAAAHTGGARPESPRGVSKGAFALAVILAMVATGLATAYGMRELAPPAGAGETVVVVEPEPADATVRMNGAEIAAGEPAQVPETEAVVELEVERSGYRTWHFEMARDELADGGRGARQFFVPLARERSGAAGEAGGAGDDAPR